MPYRPGFDANCRRGQVALHSLIMTEQEPPSLARGADLIRQLAKTLPDTPGVYRMLNEAGDILYVGKAKSLRKRVVSYANVDKLSVRIRRMVAETSEMMFVNTHTEVEALLLESNLIKKLKPRYNVLMRDDKSFPYIFISGDHDFPLLTKHRGAQKRSGNYFGPFASGMAVNQTILTLQKAFMLRSCSDTVFSGRTRPCLQYHIKRCSAPCVNLVSKEEYGQQIKQAKAFLAGKSTEVQAGFAKLMQEASDARDYEKAAQYRDRIRALTAIQAHQDINIRNLGDADVIGMHREGGKSCIQVFFFRGGQNFGNRAYFPRHMADDFEENILSAFLAQFYENKPIPGEIIVSHDPLEKKLLEEAFTTRREGGKAVRITLPQGGARKRLVEFVVRNAKDALEREQLKAAGEKILLDGVAALFDLEEMPKRIEVYDNSHISGTNMVGAMIVAGPEGLRKNSYRKFNIKQAAESDDYGMMREVITRRFGRALKEEKGPGTEDWPDLVLIDGGKGQLGAVMEALQEMGIAEELAVVSIAKGPDRNAGREKFFMEGRDMFQLPENDPVLHYLQRLRDEAHRFAIGAHRTRRSKEISKSPLDDIPGIGAKRKKAILHHFGSAEAVSTAGVKDLQQVPGISKAVAEAIYSYFQQK